MSGGIHLFCYCVRRDTSVLLICQWDAYVLSIGVFDWAIGHELIFRSSHFLIRLVPVTKQLHDHGYFVLTGQKGPVT